MSEPTILFLVIIAAVVIILSVLFLSQDKGKYKFWMTTHVIAVSVVDLADQIEKKLAPVPSDCQYDIRVFSPKDTNGHYEALIMVYLKEKSK